MTQGPKKETLASQPRPRRRRRHYASFVGEPGLPPVVRLVTEKEELDRIQEVINSDTELKGEI